jgi:hypothetical protein
MLPLEPISLCAAFRVVIRRKSDFVELSDGPQPIQLYYTSPIFATHAKLRGRSGLGWLGRLGR